ncbi:MAG: hypothetical protein ACI35O_06335 [Bacillaceae bacterium]
MCTSFVHRKDDIIIGMNFDNNGMNFKIDTSSTEQFVVYVNGGRGLTPSFGINRQGIFINHLMVDSNGKGLYKRPSKKRTHTVKLVNDILNGTIPAENINNYLQNTEVVNVPDFSIHNLICDEYGNVWGVEPGRGIIYSPVTESNFFIMSNCSLCDYKNTGKLLGSGSDRYQVAQNLLSKHEHLTIEGAFNILKTVKQTEGEWRTAVSMVYSKKEQAIFYCLDGNFDKQFTYSFL